jgi:DNA-binding CsgD family transcriptional regulator
VTSTPVQDIVQEAQRIVEEAEKKGIILRLFGGMAIRFRCPSATHRGLQRKYADIDVMGLSKQSKEIKKLFIDLGYTPRQIFNAMQGSRRLIFNDIEQGRRVDIFLDVFEMCHRFDFRDRLSLDKPTIPLVDLLATKLQVVEITEREYRDIIALLHDHEIADKDSHEVINGAFLAKMCGDDWGIYKTFTIILGNILSSLDGFELSPSDREQVKKRIEDLQSRIENAPKSMRWRMRAKIGEKKQWYELPERDKEVVDSRIYSTATETK